MNTEIHFSLFPLHFLNISLDSLEVFQSVNWLLLGFTLRRHFHLQSPPTPPRLPPPDNHAHTHRLLSHHLGNFRTSKHLLNDKISWNSIEILQKRWHLMCDCLLNFVVEYSEINPLNSTLKAFNIFINSA